MLYLRSGFVLDMFRVIMGISSYCQMDLKREAEKPTTNLMQTLVVSVDYVLIDLGDGVAGRL
jgi:hypothetical protein